MKNDSPLVKLSTALALAAILVGCSKSAKTEITEAKPGAPVVANTDAIVAAAELPPLTPETTSIISSNQTARVYDQVFYLTNSSIPSVQKSVALMQLLPSFDRDGQRAVAHAAMKYVPDANYTLVSKPLVEGKMDPQVLSIFMTETLKRPDAIRIPILKLLAEAQDHRMKEEATDLLAALTNHPTAEGAQKQVAN